MIKNNYNEEEYNPIVEIGYLKNLIVDIVDEPYIDIDNLHYLYSKLDEIQEYLYNH